MKKAGRKSEIYAYGFDELGVDTTSDPIEEDNCSIRFLDFKTDESLENANGIIIPSGIFEFSVTQPHGYGTRTLIDYDENHLAKREKEIFLNLCHEGKPLVGAQPSNGKLSVTSTEIE